MKTFKPIWHNLAKKIEPGGEAQCRGRAVYSFGQGAAPAHSEERGNPHPIRGGLELSSVFVRIFLDTSNEVPLGASGKKSLLLPRNIRG
jgi:hypothetical protein